ncbi:MAG: hypothetical protein JKY88_05505 [Pseudomonadales bacterium]|nr:hypothetical protein [Pseudomonadales bacterium]
MSVGALLNDQVQWGAFGFILAIATQSLNKAKPRGHSNIDYEQDDQLMFADHIECLTFGIGHGESLSPWLDILKSKKHLKKI